MGVAAIVRLELTRLARRSSHYAARAGLALLTLYVSGAIAYCGTSVMSRPNGLRLEAVLIHGPEIAERALLELTWAQMVAILLLVPGLAAASIAEEDRRGTLEGLLTSRLSAGAIVVGKLAARLVVVAMIVAVGMPLVVPAVLMGLLGPMLLARASGMLAALGFFVAALALLAAAAIPRPRTAITAAYILVAAWLVVPIWLMPAVRGLTGPWAWVKGLTECALLSHPSEAALGLSIPWTRLYGDPSTNIGWIWLGLSRLYVEPSGWGLIWGALPRTFARVAGTLALAGLLCLGAAALVVRPRRLGLRYSQATRKVTASTHRRAQDTTGAPIGDDAMLWKEKTAGSHRLRPAVTLGIAVLLAVILARLAVPVRDAFVEWSALWLSSESSVVRRWQLNESLRSISAALYLVGLVVVASAAATSVAGERERGTWPALLASPLEGREVAFAKVFGVLWQVRWLAAPFLILGTIGLLAGSVHPLGALASAISLIVYAGYAAAVGVLCSMRSATSERALMATLLILLISNMLPLLFVPLELIGPMAGSREALFMAGVTPFVQWLAPVSPVEIEAAIRGWAWEGRIALPFTFWSIRVPLEAGLIRLYAVSVLLHIAGALAATWSAAFAFEHSRVHRAFLAWRSLALPGSRNPIQ
jgi:ABC-type transport system involved in multi-copper enzyme maturation permease subunit